MYTDSTCSCFFAELVNALVMVHPLYFVIVPRFSDNVIVSYSESTFCCVSIMCSSGRLPGRKIKSVISNGSLLSCLYFQ